MRLDIVALHMARERVGKAKSALRFVKPDVVGDTALGELNEASRLLDDTIASAQVFGGHGLERRALLRSLAAAIAAAPLGRKRTAEQFFAFEVPASGMSAAVLDVWEAMLAECGQAYYGPETDSVQALVTVLVDQTVACAVALEAADIAMRSGYRMGVRRLTNVRSRLRAWSELPEVAALEERLAAA